MIKRLIFLLLLLLCQFTNRIHAQKLYVDSQASLTEKIKTKNAHITTLFYLEDGNLYSFGSERKQMMLPQDTRGNSFLSLLDSNTLQKTKDWDLGELEVNGKKIVFIEKVVLSKKVWLIFKAKKDDNQAYYKTRVFPDGKIGKFKEIFSTDTKGFWSKVYFDYSPDSTFLLMHTTLNSAKKGYSYITVFDQDFRKHYSKPLVIESKNQAKQTITAMKMSNSGYVYYTTYEEDLNRSFYNSIADVGTNKYYLYALSGKNRTPKYTYAVNEEVYHGMGIHLTDDNLVQTYSFYSYMYTLREHDKKVMLNGIVTHLFEQDLGHKPTVKHEQFQNSKLQRLLIDSPENSGDKLKVLKAGSEYRKCFYRFPQIKTLTGGNKLLIAEQYTATVTPSYAGLVRSALVVFKISNFGHIQSYRFINSLGGTTRQKDSPSHLLLKNDTLGFTLLVDVGYRMDSKVKPIDIEFYFNSLIKLPISTTGELGEQTAILASSGNLNRYYNLLDETILNGQKKWIMPVVNGSGFKIAFLKFKL